MLDKAKDHEKAPHLTLKSGGYIAVHHPESLLARKAAFLAAHAHEITGFGKLMRFGGAALKILGPLGVIGALAEADMLVQRAHSAESLGLIPSQSLLEYKALIALHSAQATADPSLLGGEVAIQAAFDSWAKKYDIPDFVQKELEPSSLLEMAFGQIKVIETKPALSEGAIFNALPSTLAGREDVPPEVESLMVFKTPMMALAQEMQQPNLPPAARAEMDN